VEQWGEKNEKTEFPHTTKKSKAEEKKCTDLVAYEREKKLKIKYDKMNTVKKREKLRIAGVNQ
jgi:hypothetical protein